MSFGTREIQNQTEIIADFFYPLYQFIFSEDSDFVASLDTKLSEARMSDTVELYLTKALAVGTFAGAILWLLGLFIGYVLFVLGIVSTENLIGLPVSNPTLLAIIEAIKIPALVFLTALVFGSIGFAFGFGGLVSIPYFRANEREREINMLLPDAVSFMYALSMGGLNQLEILE
ncbi:MAG: flagella assembly protein j, partial [Halobacteriaceae archaeon]